jgi:hypothetical protein
MVVTLNYAAFKTLLTGGGTYLKYYLKINGYYIAYAKCQVYHLMHKCNIENQADVTDFDVNFKTSFTEVEGVTE